MVALIKIDFCTLIAFPHPRHKIFEEGAMRASCFFSLSNDVESKTWSQTALLRQ